MWNELTIPIYANVPRYSGKAGKANPRFLGVGICQDVVLQPFIESLPGRMGPFIFEFQRSGLEPEPFLDVLDGFLAKLPPGYPYAVEVRNPAMLSPRYREMLRQFRIAHAYNHWTGMTPLLTQHRLMEERFTASFFVMRLLTPLGLPYASAVQRYAPYNQIVTAQTQMRQEAASRIHTAVSQHTVPYVLVNNRSEGNAPLTVQGIVAALTALPR